MKEYSYDSMLEEAKAAGVVSEQKNVGFCVYGCKVYGNGAAR